MQAGNQICLRLDYEPLHPRPNLHETKRKPTPRAT